MSRLSGRVKNLHKKNCRFVSRADFELLTDYFKSVMAENNVDAVALKDECERMIRLTDESARTGDAAFLFSEMRRLASERQLFAMAYGYYSFLDLLGKTSAEGWMPNSAKDLFSMIDAAKKYFNDKAR